MPFPHWATAAQWGKMALSQWANAARCGRRFACRWAQAARSGKPSIRMRGTVRTMVHHGTSRYRETRAPTGSPVPRHPSSTPRERPQGPASERPPGRRGWSGPRRWVGGDRRGGRSRSMFLCSGGFQISAASKLTRRGLRRAQRTLGAGSAREDFQFVLTHFALERLTVLFGIANTRIKDFQDLHGRSGSPRESLYYPLGAPCWVGTDEFTTSELEEKNAEIVLCGPDIDDRCRYDFGPCSEGRGYDILLLGVRSVRPRVPL